MLKQVRRLSFFIVLLFLLQSSHVIAGSDQRILIGVRAHLGADVTIQRWSETANYLSESIQGYSFTIVPYVYISEMEEALKNKKVHFVITQPVAYVDLEILFGASRLLTLVKKGGLKEFSSIIFTRSDNADIYSLTDIKNKSFGAVTPKGFGGWLMAKYEFTQQKINPEKDFSQLEFLDFQQEVVRGVLTKKIDAGTVRTGIIEKMINDGELSYKDIRIINSKKTSGFPYVYSTDLYPEWVLAKTNKASTQLAELVTKALLNLPLNHPAANAGNYEKWTVSLDYQSVHYLMKKLKVGYYEDISDFDFVDAILKYKYAVFTVVMVFVLHFFYSVKIKKVNHQLIKQISENRLLIEKINDIATHDSLTGLPNRNLTFEFIRKEINQSQRTNSLIALMFIDIDGFKQVNDELGHQKGDDLLINIGGELLHQLRESDTAGRIGGDEFLVLLSDVHQIKDVERVADKIIHFFQNIKELEAVSQSVGASIGIIVLVAKKDTRVKDIVSLADQLMYEAKTNGGSQYRLKNLNPEKEMHIAK
ncbi:MAG: diguanylate cyclase [Gammaproteobacteria bacterium]|nr:diguanylate cyclase [Gammaproteobacteria bacterium]